MISAFTSAEIYRTNEFTFVGRKTKNPQTNARLIQWGEDGRWFVLGLVRNTHSSEFVWERLFSANTSW